MCAGALDTFEIFVWSMQTGRLLEVSECDCLTVLWSFKGGLDFFHKGVPD